MSEQLTEEFFRWVESNEDDLDFLIRFDAI